jgi:hypothetical protein
MNSRKAMSAIFLFVIAFSCEEKGKYPTLINCSSSLIECGNVDYCTWGFKFGDNNPYSPSGANIPGPKSKVASISYKFLDAGKEFKTTLQDAAMSMDIDGDYREEIRKVISEWSSVANINFIEKPANELTNITIASAFIPISSSGGLVGGLGHPAFLSEPCKQIAGLLVLSSKFRPMPRVILHEMGHVLGLGHVSSENVMNPNNSNYEHLQPGDIAGIQSIYGSK